MGRLENRSLDRGITIMEALAHGGSATLADLHRTSGLPKSTIRRLLATLIERRLVRRSIADGRYRINIALPVSTSEPIPPQLTFLVDVALPHVVDLTRAVRWPSEIHVLDGVRMRIVDSTRPLSPFHLYQGVVNRMISIFGSASGAACLSAMQDRAIADFHERTKNDRKWGLLRFGMGLDDYMREVAKARARGYGVRMPGYLGETIEDDGLAAIAVPLTAGTRPSGALNLLWPRAFRSHEDFASEFLPALKETAEKVTHDLARFEHRS